MKTLNLAPADLFEIVADTERAQAATMVFTPGQSTGGPDNRHEQSDQWLYVISDRGKGVVAEQEVSLGSGTLLLIESGEAHELFNTGDEPLKTFNLYTPPAY